MELCACGSEKDYLECCGLFISGKSTASTPEELMRSRYTAYTQANVDYIEATMKPPAANHFNKEEARRWASQANWLKLEVIQSYMENNKGYVEFLAHFTQDTPDHPNKRHVIHELSEFHLIDGKWYYVDGKDPRAKMPFKVTPIGRNESCICGSGKKYKKCCGGLNTTGAATH